MKKINDLMKYTISVIIEPMCVLGGGSILGMTENQSKDNRMS